MEGLSQGKINESINNVFRSAKSQQRKVTIHSSQEAIPGSFSTAKKIRVSDVENNKESI